MIFDLPLDQDFNLKIGAHTWRVRIVEEITVPDDSNEYMWGSCCFQTLTIFVVRRADLDYSMVLSSFLHEVLHAYEYTFSIKISHKDLGILGEVLAETLLRNFSNNMEGKDE